MLRGTGWKIYVDDTSFDFHFSLRVLPIFGFVGKHAGVKYFAIPLLWPCLIIAIPTGMLFWRDCRPPKGHCQNCGYNLTGNVSGRCPECGEPTERESGGDTQEYPAQ